MTEDKTTKRAESKTARQLIIMLLSVILVLSLSLIGCDQTQKGVGSGAGSGAGAGGNAGAGAGAGSGSSQDNAQNSQGTTAGKADYVSISAEEAKKIIDANSEVILLDVRTQQEFADGHIPGAICVPVETIGSNPPSELPDKDATILVYCRSGNRSKQAAEKLVALGYTDIREFGGINSWPYEITK